MPFDVQQHAEKSVSGGIAGASFRFFIRFMQFVMGLAVVGLYGTDVNKARQSGVGGDPKWVYALVIGTMSAFTSIIFSIPLVKSYLFFAWDACLFLFWLVIFGMFGKMYIPEDAEGNAGITRMKHAVWVDLANMLMWLVTAIYGGFLFKRYRGMSIPKMPSSNKSEV
ncbi:MAG: hypothetical protein M1814_001584 [Vezdaea aestivalis]|nr:MAG: hypothetical protein M1814_001584 [Vezdaea aestivalis]